MSDVNGAFSLTQSPQALPGKCGQCGKAKDNLGFIDTGLQFDFYGALIFCSECVLDMASKFGYINMETADNLKSRVAALEEENMRQRAALLGLEEALDGLQLIRDNLGVGIIDKSRLDTLIKPETSELPTKETAEPTPVSETTEPNVESGNSEANESPSEQIPVGVSSSSKYVDLDEL